MYCKCRGFTMIELLMVGLVVIVLSIGLSNVFLRAQANYEAVLTQNEIQRQARVAADIVCDEIRHFGDRGDVPGSDFWAAIIDGGVDYFSVRNDTFGMVPWRVYREAGTSSLVREYGGEKTATVGHITGLKLTYLTRIPSDVGTVVWKQQSPLRAAYAKYLCAVQVSVTASANGHSCTINSTVKLRNQLYWIIPPAGPV